MTGALPDPAGADPAVSGWSASARLGSARRGLTAAVAGCAAGAAAALLASGRAWTATETPRPQPLPPLHVTHPGSALLPWLPALALVGLAGAGALLATRGRVRSGVGAVIALAGIGVVIGGLIGFRYTIGWPLLVIAGGLAICWYGVQTIRCGYSWPAMGSRYERRPPVPVDRPVTDVSMWDDLDRGVDPTERD